MNIKKADIILIVLLLLLSVAVFFGYRALNSLDGDGGRVLISQGGSEYSRLNLSENGIYLIRAGQPLTKLDEATVPSDIRDQHYNIIEIKNGQASMILAGCPDLLCVHQRAIQAKGEEIVCLPNKVIIEVVNGKASDVDDVAS